MRGSFQSCFILSGNQADNYIAVDGCEPIYAQIAVSHPIQISFRAWKKATGQTIAIQPDWIEIPDVQPTFDDALFRYQARTMPRLVR